MAIASRCTIGSRSPEASGRRHPRRVAGLLAANALCDGGLTPDAMLSFACHAEGHADNAAAALLGGFVVVSHAGGDAQAVRIEPPDGLLAVLFIPDRPLSTSAMRAALPLQVPFADAVHNVGASSLAVAAFASGRLDLLVAATDDRLHEPYRALAYPELPVLIAAARAAGALGRVHVGRRLVGHRLCGWRGTGIPGRQGTGIRGLRREPVRPLDGRPYARPRRVHPGRVMHRDGRLTRPRRAMTKRRRTTGSLGAICAILAAGVIGGPVGAASPSPAPSPGSTAGPTPSAPVVAGIPHEVPDLEALFPTAVDGKPLFRLSMGRSFIEAVGDDASLGDLNAMADDLGTDLADFELGFANDPTADPLFNYTAWRVVGVDGATLVESYARLVPKTEVNAFARPYTIDGRDVIWMSMPYNPIPNIWFWSQGDTLVGIQAADIAAFTKLYGLLPGAMATGSPDPGASEG